MTGCGPQGPFLADCPARLTVDLLTDKWAMVILAGLSDGPLHHGELGALIGGVSRKVLTQTLRRLERRGLVARRAYAAAPPRVEYRLTEIGCSLLEPIRVLNDWALRHGDEIPSAT